MLFSFWLARLPEEQDSPPRLALLAATLSGLIRGKLDELDLDDGWYYHDKQSQRFIICHSPGPTFSYIKSPPIVPVPPHTTQPVRRPFPF